MKFIFNREIVTLGLRRGGIHGMLVWICGMFDGKYIVHLNTRLRGFKDWYIFSDKNKKFTKSKISFIKYLKRNNLPLNFYINSVEQSTPKKFVSVDNNNYKRKKEKIVNDLSANSFSKSRKYVLFLRNPFNNLASLMEARRNKRYPKSWFAKEIRLFRKNWIAYAKEFVGKTNYITKKNKINYDHWISDENYRKNISEKLRLPFNDRNFGKMPHAGSSFDNFKFKTKAYNMDVLNRWTKYKNCEEYNKILFYTPLLDLYNEIFGDLPYKI